MKLIISKVNSKDSIFQDEYIITYNELNLVFKSSADRYKELTRSLKNLASFYIQINNKDKIVEFGLIQNKWTYKKYNKNITIHLHEDLMPLLLDIKKNFTKYNIKNLKMISSKYDLKMYEFLKSFEGMRQITVTLEKIRNVLELQDKYPKFFIFKNKILNKAIEHINEHTDIEVYYETESKNRQVEKLKFYIIPNNERLQLEVELDFIKSYIGKGANLDEKKMFISEINKKLNRYQVITHNKEKNIKGTTECKTFDELSNYLHTSFIY